MRRLNQNIPPRRAHEILDKVQSYTESGQKVTVHCKLITPMYGGGVKVGEIDREMPIRASSIRGHLRFWWRLLNGAGQSSPDLFANESKLWGGISRKGPRASRVTLRVKCAQVNDQNLIKKRELEKAHLLPTYALILDPSKNPTFLNAGYAFDLVLRFEQSVKAEERKGVIEALRWWASFSGIGARTRRGFGAVEVTTKDVELEPVSPEEVERHGGRMVLSGRPNRCAMKVWKEAIDALKQFRQGKGIGRASGSGNRPGRSLWPEADSIRRLKGTHAPSSVPKHPVDGFYPRAAFGLPLVFHFKDKNKGDPKGKNGDSLELSPVVHDRMASPLTLRPWFNGRDRYCSAALLLPGWEERVSVPVILDMEHETPAWPKNPDERGEQARNIKPMRTQGATDALSAFMTYFEERTPGGR